MTKQKTIKLFIFAILIIVSSNFCLAETSVMGLWKTIDDDTGEVRALVRVVERDGKLYGIVEKLVARPMDDVCDLCEPPFKDKPIVGMQIIDGLTRNGFYYSNGNILDPGNGKMYRCKVWLDTDDRLNVRGYIGFLYRTQKWYRVSDADTDVAEG